MEATTAEAAAGPEDSEDRVEVVASAVTTVEGLAEDLVVDLAAAITEVVRAEALEEAMGAGMAEEEATVDTEVASREFVVSKM